MKKNKRKIKSEDKVVRVKTGIEKFDKLIQGGVPERSVNLVAGDAGSGKTIFAIEYLVNGMIKYNENCLYITFEEKKDVLYKNMLGFGWDLAKLEKQGKFTFLEYTPEQVKKMIIEGGGIVENIIRKKNIRRLVVDSITSFSLLYTDELERKEAALVLFDLFSKWGCTTLLTSQAEPTLPGSLSESLKFEVDGIILIYFVRTKGLRQRAIEIVKMRGTKTPLKTIALTITSDGIGIEANKVVNI